ncbi:SDR family NAD(P)-dependent oxidoreductase [Dactylosporangium sucinum]|uniref:3-oxoacyl-ACP reductase n=1 Tax=Dactylosporangium sucinum TaxID=1424081 RepID=A0A917U9U4_9ACTN|nr:SDR family NAD(P)-dependent oxidoreductase [Dactylosporangium sucinum]GGM64694.1 3-oxoacyl-ACP reductase [Dactylosporangium sucinum]
MSVVLVTGAAGAMGQEVCSLLAESGKRVVCADINDPSAVAQGLAGRGHDAIATVLDVTDPGSWCDAVAQARDRFGGVDALVNVAATVTDGPDSVLDVDVAEWRRVLDVNVIGLALGMSAVAPALRRSGGGRIVNVASIVGLRGNATHAAYSASKGGVIALTRQAAVALAPYRITVNCVAPGVMEKAMLGKDTNTEDRAQWLAGVPFARAVREIEVARAIDYFLAPEAGIVTGQVLAVDGGRTARL